MPPKEKEKENENENEKSLTAQTLEDLAKQFAEVLKQYPHAGDIAVGRTHYGVELQERTIVCYKPLLINDILGEQFIRRFYPTLLAALEFIKNHSHINKTDLPLALLKKYILPKSGADQPHAYFSLPQEDSIDYELHLYYLQPFRLFSMIENDRKFVGTSRHTKDREWFWNAGLDGDSALFFRNIIQIFLLCEILEEERSKKLENSKLINEVPNLDKRRKKLLATIPQQAVNLLAKAVAPSSAPRKLEGSPYGLHAFLFGGQEGQGTTFIPAFVLSMQPHFRLYGFGRLIMGEFEEEPRSLYAENAVRMTSNVFLNRLQYGLFWILAHLNISTVLWEIKGISSAFMQSVQKFLYHLSQKSLSLKEVGVNCIAFGMRVLGLTLLPVMILFTSLSGVTSILFSLLRAFVLHNPYGVFKHYNWLKLLDILESLKDTYLFLFLFVPALNVLLAGVSALIPALFLQCAIVVPVILMICLSAFLNVNEVSWCFFFNIVDNLPLPLRVMSAIFLGAGLSFFCSVSFSWTLKQVLPARIEEAILQLGFLWQAGWKRFQQAVIPFFTLPPPNPLQAINPQPYPNLPLPVTAAIKLPVELQNAAEELRQQLGKIVSFNQSPAQLAERRALLSTLEMGKAPSISHLTQAIGQAQAIAVNIFTQEEIKQLKKILEKFPYREKWGKEKAALRAAEVNGAYHPSWDFAKLLQKPQQNLPASLQEKCARIVRLAPT